MKRLSSRNEALLKHIINQGITPKEAIKEIEYIKKYVLVINNSELWNYVYNTIEDIISNGDINKLDKDLYKWTIENTLYKDYYDNLANEAGIQCDNSIKWYIETFGEEDFNETIKNYNTIDLYILVTYILYNELQGK